MALPLPGGLDPDPDRQQKFEALAKAVPGYGGLAVEERFGVSILTWPGATTISGTLTVTHGLGRAPVNVQATTKGILGEVLCAEAGNYTATTFDLHAQFVAGFTPAAAATFQVAWRAVG